MTDSLWYKDAVFYELYPRAFFDSNADGHGDLRGILSKLDYLHDLGVDCLWLLPIFESPLVDDGYDVSDFYNIQPRFGTVEDFKALIDAAHARGMRVIADLVMNHTSDQHPWFVESRASRNSPKRDYYIWNRDDQKFRDARIIFIDSQKSNWQFDPPTGEYYFHRFFAEQPDLNYDNPAVQQAMLDIVAHWLDFGLDGFRCDAVPYLFKREGTNCENLPETHAFLKRVRRFIDEKYPGKLLLAEANQPPAETREYFGDGDQFQMGFHFPLMPQIFIALKKQDARPIIDVLRRTPLIPDSAQWGIFLRNHDELTLEMVTPHERDFLWREYAPAPRMRLNLGIRRRLAPLLDNDPRKIKLAYSLLLTL
ncbi:MAG TPA: alpha-amylase family protein, partial [Anaerolineae bacterium]